jgi:hypothetical protein
MPTTAKLETKLLHAAVIILGDEMAEAIDGGHTLVPGADPIVVIDDVVTIAGVERHVKLTFAMTNVEKE